jgi:DNA-binding XRE family transcriptional regulator
MKREWLTEMRQERELTLKDVSKEIGCSFNYLCEIEKGRRSPRVPLAKRIAKFFDIDVMKLYDNENETA